MIYDDIRFACGVTNLRDSRLVRIRMTTEKSFACEDSVSKFTAVGLTFTSRRRQFMANFWYYYSLLNITNRRYRCRRVIECHLLTKSELKDTSFFSISSQAVAELSSKRRRIRFIADVVKDRKRHMLSE